MCGTWYDVNTNYLSYPRYIHLGNTYKSGSSITVVSCQLTFAKGTLYEHHKAININTSSFINTSTYYDYRLANLTPAATLTKKVLIKGKVWEGKLMRVH